MSKEQYIEVDYLVERFTYLQEFLKTADNKIARMAIHAGPFGENANIIEVVKRADGKWYLNHGMEFNIKY